MIISLLPTTALAAEIPEEYKPTIEWTDIGSGTIDKYTLTVNVYYEGKYVGTDSSGDKHLSAKVTVPSTMEVQKYEVTGYGCGYSDVSKLFTFLSHVVGGSTEGTLNLYLRSKAGHTVTVNYVFADKSGNTKGPIEKQVKYQDHEDFELAQPNYNCTISKKSGDATHEVTGSTDSTRKLRVTGGAKNSVFTVTYTPKDNYIYIDKYFGNGGIFSKWDGENIKLNGYEFVENNALSRKYVIENHKLAPAMEKYRFLTVTNADNSTTVYDFSYAVVIPKTSESTSVKIKDVWYDRDAGEWYYSYDDPLGLFDQIPLVNVGGVNFCYNKEHNKESEYHDFVATTVDPTCTEQGYTVYKCKYCGMTKQDDFKKPLDHDWGTYVHVEGTDKEASQHQRVCQREGCNATSTPEGCNFVDTPIETGTRHTCKDCGYYYDESAPKTTPVYVYFKTVHSKDGNVRVNDGVTYNNNTGNNNTGEKWATLGKLTTKLEVNASNKDALGNEVKTSGNFEKHDSNKDFDLKLIEWVELKKDNGVAGYGDAPEWAWHLNGKVNVYKLSYDANLPDGVAEGAVTGMPDSAYYLPGGNAPVSTADPKLQGYDFGGWYTEETCEHKVEKTVTVTEDTVLYAKWKPITADLIDDDITITHGVDATPADGDDTAAHIVNKDATISYQATLDMQSLKFGANPEHADTVSLIKTKIGKASLWEFMEAENITTFAGSEVNLHVKFSEELVNPATLNGITLESGWFKRDPASNPTYDETTKYWTIPCVIKDATDAPDIDTNDSIVTLSGITLSLTDKAQGKLNSNTALDITSEGYIDGTIMISGQALKLESKTAKNTAKLKLAVPTYTVTYRGNGADSGETTDNTAYAPGTTATVKENGFTRSRYTFTGWNMKADGSGTPYKAGEQITMNNNVILYAQWTRNSSHGDDDDKYFFAIQKVDAQDGHALNDAKFELYQRDSRDNKLPASRKTTAHWGPESGIALFSVSATKTSDGGSTWYYREITAPEGYVLDTKEYEISAGDFYHDDQSKAVAKAKTVRNYRGTTPDLLNDSDHFAYVIGYMDGNVRPYGLISRAETTTIFFRLLKDSVRDGNLLTSNTYTDVADDYWANTAISTMTGLGIVQGRSTTTFDPKAPITRAQFAAICARFDTGKSSGEQTFSDIQGHWAEKYIQRAAELGWIKGFEDGTFRPDTYITRAQAMTMINRVLNRIPEDESDLLPGMNVWPDCNPGDWFYLAVQEATNSHDFKHKAGNYETWTGMNKDPDWTRYEN